MTQSYPEEIYTDCIFDFLPDEIVIKIFNYLGPFRLVAMKVCYKWRNYIINEFNFPFIEANSEQNYSANKLSINAHRKNAEKKLLKELFDNYVGQNQNDFNLLNHLVKKSCGAHRKMQNIFKHNEPVVIMPRPKVYFVWQLSPFRAIPLLNALCNPLITVKQRALIFAWSKQFLTTPKIFTAVYGLSPCYLKKFINIIEEIVYYTPEKALYVYNNIDEKIISLQQINKKFFISHFLIGENIKIINEILTRDVKFLKKLLSATKIARTDLSYKNNLKIMSRFIYYQRLHGIIKFDNIDINFESVKSIFKYFGTDEIIKILSEIKPMAGSVLNELNISILSFYSCRMYFIEQTKKIIINTCITFPRPRLFYMPKKITQDELTKYIEFIIPLFGKLSNVHNRIAEEFVSTQYYFAANEIMIKIAIYMIKKFPGLVHYYVQLICQHFHPYDSHEVLSLYELRPYISEDFKINHKSEHVFNVIERIDNFKNIKSIYKNDGFILNMIKLLCCNSHNFYNFINTMESRQKFIRLKLKKLIKFLIKEHKWVVLGEMNKYFNLDKLVSQIQEDNWLI